MVVCWCVCVCVCACVQAGYDGRDGVQFYQLSDNVDLVTDTNVAQPGRWSFNVTSKQQSSGIFSLHQNHTTAARTICYSTVALVPPMSTMYVWRGIT